MFARDDLAVIPCRARAASRPLVAVVIPVHNGIQHTLRCLSSLLESEFTTLEIIVVDDGSNDGTSDTVSSKFPSVTILHGEGSLWWTGATNLGARYAVTAGADYVMLLNNDCVVKLDCISQLVAAAEENADAIVASKVLDLDNHGCLFYAGGIIDWRWGSVRLLREHEIAMRPKHKGCLVDVDYSGGMGVLIRRSFLDALNYFDERTFPHYWADTDFCLRAKQQGYRLLVNLQAVTWIHSHSTGTMGRILRGDITHPKQIWGSLTSIRSYMNLVSVYRFFRRHCPRRYFPWALIYLYSRYLTATTACLVVNRAKRLARGWPTTEDVED